MVRVIEIRRKRFKSEKLRDTMLGREPQEECVDLITIEEPVKAPTEADIEHESGKKKEEDPEAEDGEDDEEEEA
ncbi:MAG TPA: hypothetical protein VMW36_08285 [Patescibacteria group bacterium]|nr:hypothetical protein [Patescibacteria group bacterium]